MVENRSKIDGGYMDTMAGRRYRLGVVLKRLGAID